MSPIIKESDGTEQIILDTNNAGTPFPEDIHLQANSHQAETLEVTDTVDKPSNNGVNNDKKQSVKNGIHIKRKESFNSGQKDKKSIPKREGLLKRSQSLRTRPSPYDQNNSKVTANQKRTATHANNDNNITSEKQSKPGKFKIFKNRWSMFQKPSNAERGSQELYDLRRSQSMRIPSKHSQSVNILKSVTENGAKVSQLEKKENKFVTKNDIKNSKSLSDVRYLSKKYKSESINNGNTINNNYNNNNNHHNRRNLTPVSSRLILNEKIQTSPSLSTIPTTTTTTKNFAHKTIDVIRKSVQSKFKNAYLDKQSKKKESNENDLGKNITEAPKSAKEKDKSVFYSNRDKVKINSKRKEMDVNDCDSEFKPKKKITSLETPKTKTIKAEKSKANSTTYFKTKDKIGSVDNKANKEFSNEAKMKNKMRNNKIIKNDKNHSIALISEQKNQFVVAKSTLPTNLINCSTENNNNISSASQNLFYNSSYTIQNHHVLFLNDIHENLSNNYKRKLEIIPIFDVNFDEPKAPEKQKSRESTPINFNKPDPSNLRRSLSFDSDKASSGMTSISYVSNAFTRSCSETRIDERSLSITNNEILAKSTSPMSISNCDDETVKAENEQSVTSFNCNYDPYIDETMDDFLFEGEEESYFGSLFAESKTTWTNLVENFKLDLDFSGECYYMDNISFNFENDCNRNKLTPSSDFSYNSLSLQLNGSFSFPENSPKSLPSDAEIKIYDSNRNSDLQFSDLVNKNFLTFSHSAIENSGKREPKKAMSSRKPKDTARIKSKLNFASEKTKDNANKPVRNEGLKETKEKTSSLKKHLTDSKIKRKASGKSNLNEASPSMSPESKIIRLKETSKQINSEDAKSSPELMRNKIRRKSISENSITRKHEEGDSTLTKKVELEEGKRDTRNQSKTIEPKVAVSHNTNKTDEKKALIEAKSLQNKSSAASGVPNTPGVRAAAKDRGPRPLPNRAVSRLSGTSDAPDEKKCQEMLTAASRRSKIDNSKAALTKTFRGTATVRGKQTDPVKILRPTAPNGQTPSPLPSQISEQLKKLEAEISARTQEAQKSREEVAKANGGIEALTVLVHYLTNEYDAFSTPKLRAEIESLTSQLTDVRLCLDESSAAARRLEIEAAEQCQKHEEVVNNLEEAHRQEVSSITLEHQRKLDEVVEKHNKDLNDAKNVEEEKRELLITAHKEQLEKIETQWKEELDKQHQRHLQALEQLNACHNEQLRSSEEAWKLREQELQESNAKLLKEQNNLKQQAKKLEETLLSDKDHRLQAAKRVCGALQNEVDSLKTVVDMRNSEVHKLRDQLADKERICEELDSARDRVRALQAKAEDLHAQMETKLQLERQLLTDRHSLTESLQREASVNKRLSLENEELQWKLRQRDSTPNSSHTSSSLDLVSRCSPGNARQQEGCNNGVLSPQFTPRSQRIGTKPHDKKWSQSFSNIPEDAGKLLRRTELHHGNVMIESPPPSPRVKAVIEKSNSVSFILDLNDTYPNEHLIGAQSYHQLRKSSTSNLQRKPFTKSYSSNLEKSKSTSLVQGSSKTFDVNKSSREKLNKKENVNGECDSDVYKTENGKHSKYDRTCSTSESSDSGEIERISPTGLSWTVPVHSKRYSKHIPSNRFQLVPETPRLLQQPDEDEYEEAENENEFVEVLALGEDINSAPLTMLFAQTPSTSVSLSDSDVSQCGSRADITSDDDDDDDDDDGTLLQKESQSRPQEGAGEAMIYSDVFDLKRNNGSCKSISKSQISSGPSSDSEDANQATNVEEPLNLSWSEDIECDLTSSSEMQELL